MEESIKIFKLVADDFTDDDGITAISLVEHPAIEEDWITFSKDNIQEKIKFSFNEDKQILTGPVIIPNKYIYRFDYNLGNHYVFFETEMIEKLVQKFFKRGFFNETTYEHEIKLEKNYLFESWIIGENDKSKELGFDLPKGTWMVSMKIDDKELWNRVKTGEVKGFSLEGFFKRVPENEKKINTMNRFSKFLKRAFNELKPETF